ncbi:hypothetical protein QJQ45_025098 [Haematococcus lacustris]|nr:hypothetical protein QJQ45_025098 [Haematococcus lacustris]
MACGYGIDAKSSERQDGNLDKGHVADLIEEADKHRRLLGMKKQGSMQDILPLPCHMRHAVHVCRCLEQWRQPPTALEPGQPKRGRRREVGPRTLTCPPPFTLTPMARVGVHVIKLDSRVLLGGQVKHASGLNNSRRDTERWLAPIKPHLQHLAVASSAGTSLKVNLKHITTWDAVWEVYLDPKQARQRLRLYGAQDRALKQFFKQVRVDGHHVWALCEWQQLEKDIAEVSMERHGRAKQLVVLFGAASIGTRGWWDGDAVLRAYCKVVCRPRGTDQLRGRVVLVDEHRTAWVSSAVNGKQPCEEELDHEQPTRRADWKPPAGKVDLRLLRPAWSQRRDQPRSKRTEAEQVAEPTQPTKGTGKGKAAKAKPSPQPGRWLDRDCNAALNMQRIGESRWRPLELCWWPEQGALPAKGKEYPGLGYKQVRDKPPVAQQQQQQQQQPAVAQ